MVLNGLTLLHFFITYIEQIIVLCFPKRQQPHEKFFWRITASFRKFVQNSTTPSRFSLKSKWTSLQVVFKGFKSIEINFHLLQHSAYTFSLFLFALVKCVYCFSFPWIWKRINNKNFFLKFTFAVLFANVYNFFSFSFDHLNNKFQTFLSSSLDVAWNYYKIPWNNYYYHTTQMGLRTPVTCKMELFGTIFNSFQP